MNLRKMRDDDGDDHDHDLGLSLSLELKCPSHKSPKHKPSLNGIAFQSSSASRPSSFRGPNMNKMLEVEPPSLSTMSFSPDSTITSANGKRNERDEFGFERQSTNSEGGGGDDSSVRKKLRLTKEQAAVLEETFKHQCTLNQNQKMVLARQLKLQTRQVEVWFQNRRARTKFKKTEVDYVFLKRRCEDLTNENRRLQKEVAELRALKYSSHMKPPTTVSMCPRCEHMAKVPISSFVTSFTPPSATGTSTQPHVIPSDQKAPTVSNWFINRLQESRRPCV